MSGLTSDTLIFIHNGYLFKADTTFSSLDSVSLLSGFYKIQLTSDGIWIFNSTGAQHFGTDLQLVQNYSFPTSGVVGGIGITDACVSNGRFAIAGSYKNACWKTFDLNGNSDDPDYDIGITSMIIDSVSIYIIPGSPKLFTFFFIFFIIRLTKIA